MFLANVAISRTADINKKTGACLLISETAVWTIGFDLPGSGDGGIQHHSNVIRILVQAYHDDAGTICSPLEPQNDDKHPSE